MLPQVSQRSCGCLIPVSAGGQAGRDFEQPAPVRGVPTFCRAAGTR